LFDRNTKGGRKLHLTDTGQMVYRYADQIFSLGNELMTRIEGGDNAAHTRRLAVGVVDALPKLVARSLILPALHLGDEPARLVVQQGPIDRLLDALAARELDVVLSDTPQTRIGVAEQIPCYSMPLGESTVSFFASRSLIDAHEAGDQESFPACFRTMPLYLPSRGTHLRRSVDLFLQQHNVEPIIRGEFDDSTMLKTFGSTGEAAFPSLTLVADEIMSQFHVDLLGSTDKSNESLYAITAQQESEHPGVLAICQARGVASSVDANMSGVEDELAVAAE
ncbi:MAG: LysR substrate-binding domain-containing protein, partial [Planctomycetota bacterium]